MDLGQIAGITGTAPIQPAWKKQDTLAMCLRSMDISLQLRHPSVSLNANPVITSSMQDISDRRRLECVLAQYCFLPNEIVNLLNIAKSRLSAWANIKAELTRNVNEEIGSRTNGISHYQILEKALEQELGLDIKKSKQLRCTKKFLHTLKKGLASSAETWVLGAIYGLENSAIFELSVVAKLINCYAQSIGHVNPIINMPPERVIFQGSCTNYSLNTFFAMHLTDFEVGHKNGLAVAIKRENANGVSFDFNLFENGFESVLNLMDRWWEEMACL